MKPSVANQGKIVVQQNRGEFLVMFPDGSVEIAMSKDDVEKKAKRYFKKILGTSDIGVGRIEWNMEEIVREAAGDNELQQWILSILKNRPGDELRHIHWRMRAEDSKKADRLGVGAFDRGGRTKVARTLQQLRSAGKVKMVDNLGHTEWKLSEDVNVPVKKGDTILVGKWKNKPIKVTSQGEDDHGMPTINGRKAVTFRKPEPKDEGVLPMKISRATLRALIEAELAELGPKATRLGGRYGGEPDFAIADPGNKDVENPVVQTSAKGGSNKSIRRPISK